ncbi:hypothetical protein DH2020_049495 [Rehmannia glutinosa]|uniref:Uncharacterized protein n=1 Tax=Rehmannia glutinosa TaxID=99300 RepID=A0ABR0U312_REHGL
MLNQGFESLKGAEDVSVDVLEFSRSKDVRVEAKEDPDATENSSSFANTASGNENNSGLSDAEVESQFFGDSDLAPPFDGFGSVFPKIREVNWMEFLHGRTLVIQHATGNDESGIHDDCVFSVDNDIFLEHIIRKIELVHTRVFKLKAQLTLVMTKNASKFSSSENLSQLVACDVQTSSVRSPTLSACNGDTVSVGGLYTSPQHISDYDIRDFIMPDSAVSSFGEAIRIPDIIESTVGLLSSIDVTQHHAQVGDSSERIVDNILIQNEAAEAECSAFKYAHNQSAEKTQDAENSGEEESNNTMLLALEPDMVAKAVSTTDQSILESCLSSEIHFPKNKRKRGERKAGSANWSRQRPGEPDS